MSTITKPNVNIQILSANASIAANDGTSRVILPIIPPTPPLWPDPTAWWKLDELDGPILADEMGLYPLEADSDYTPGMPALLNDGGFALNVNNTGAASRTSIIEPGVGEWAVEFWVAWTNSNASTVFSKQDDTTGMKVGLNQGGAPKTISIQDQDDPDYRLAYTNNVDNVGAMLHVIAQRKIADDVGTLEIFIDGVSVATKELPDITNHNNVGANLVLFSGSVGRFDDVRYYCGTALTAEQALARYNATTQINAIPQFLGIDYETPGYQTDLVTNGNNVVMFRTNTGGMSRSLNGGATFTPIARFCGAADAVTDTADQTNTCLRHLNGSTWIASFQGGYIARTTNNGDAWTVQRLGSNDNALFRLEVDPLNNVVMAFDTNDATGGKSFMSDDGGVEYSETTVTPRIMKMGVNLTGTWIRSRTVSNTSIIERSTDGITWTALPAYLGSGASGFDAPIQMNTKNETTWAVLFSGGKLAISTDDGVTWAASVVPSGGPSFGAQIIAAGNDETWCYLNPAGVSTDDAENFTTNNNAGLYIGGNTLQVHNGQFVSGFYEHFATSLDNLASEKWLMFRKYAHTGATTGGPRSLSVYTGNHWLFVTGICNGAIWNAPAVAA